MDKDRNHNKLVSLIVAASVGLKIPPSLIANKKKYFEEWIKNSKCITKAIDNMFTIYGENTFSKVSTERIKKSNLNKLGDVFFPTLIQEEISKAYEVRFFFIKDKLYAMAIFSQRDEKTRLDYRKYNRQKPNRSIPYKLPLDVKLKILAFNDKMGLDILK